MSPGERDAQPKAVLRVRADVVDRLVNQAGEVSIARSRIEGEMRVLKTFSPPAPGDQVWIMFEQGDPRRPVWIGCGWTPTTSQRPEYES